MTIDTNRLRHLVFLATGSQITEIEIQYLSNHLSILEEVLPHLLVRRQGFAGCEKFQSALAESLKRAAAAPNTLRAKGGSSLRSLQNSEAELRAAIQAFIVRDTSDGETTARLDRAILALAAQSKAEPLDEHLRIGA